MAKTRGRAESRRDIQESPASPLRVVIDGVVPQVDGGRFAAKRTRGERVSVRAHLLVDGHVELAGRLLVRAPGAAAWQETPLAPENPGLCLWAGSFEALQYGLYEFTLEAWIDRFATWRRDLQKKFDAGQDVRVELREGALLLEETAERAAQSDARWLRQKAAELSRGEPQAGAVGAAIAEDLAAMAARYPDRRGSVRYEPALKIQVEDPLARYGAWYEFFPRSTVDEPRRHGTFATAARRLPEIAAMGFQVVYLPPIHPIGRQYRKGPNNSLKAGPHDPGSPWAIGGPEGGHKAVHPDLGSLKDFDAFVGEANRLGMEVALDIAFQCSPDHPYVKDHPEWFYHRPDGAIQYAENPPKKYQDIYPLNFECPDWVALWNELKSVVLFWAGHGVRVFRVDNPHTKTFRFWQWLIREVREAHPDAVFLAEAFTKPPVMKYLAKIGYSQSYTYFTWRNTKAELQDYFTELTQTDVAAYMRPNLFANTPDILHEFLQYGGRPAYLIRLFLAATLGASYGIYGPPFELCESRAVPGTEEYADSEKYQVRHWDWSGQGHIKEWIARVNRIRKENPALHANGRLRFYPVNNEQLLFYAKTTPDFSNIVLVVVNLDPHRVQDGWVQVPIGELGLGEGPYQVHDLLSEERYLWHGERNYVRLDPNACPAHIFRVRRKLRTERDFDYFA